MDIIVRRNAFGRQVTSFEAALEIPALTGEEAAPEADASGAAAAKVAMPSAAASFHGTASFHGIFIRAPWIESAGPGVKVIAMHDGHIVAAREGNMPVTAFYPELTDDLRLHRLFLRMVDESETNGE